MVKLGKREKIFASIFGTFLVIFLLDKGLFSPFLNKLDVIRIQITTDEKRLSKLFYIDSQKANILKSFDESREFIKIGETEEDALAVIMKKLEEMAKSSEITLLNMKPEMSSEIEEETYKVKKIDLNIEGPQNNIVKFVYSLENSPYPLSVKKLDFSIKDRDAGIMDADLAVFFIYFI